MNAAPKYATMTLPDDSRVAWQLWKWMQDICDSLWNLHGDAFMDFDLEEHAAYQHPPIE